MWVDQPKWRKHPAFKGLWGFPGKCWLTTDRDGGWGGNGTLPTDRQTQQPGLRRGERGGGGRQVQPRAGTLLCLVANGPRKTFRAEAIEGELVLAGQAGPAVQALHGVTEVTCGGSSSSGTIPLCGTYWGGPTTMYISAGGPRDRNQASPGPQGVTRASAWG